MLKKLISLLPVSRRKYIKDLEKVMIVINGLMEAEANHCQIEMSLMQQSQVNRMKKEANKKSTTNGTDPSFQ